MNVKKRLEIANEILWGSWDDYEAQEAAQYILDPINGETDGSFIYWPCPAGVLEIDGYGTYRLRVIKKGDES